MPEQTEGLTTPVGEAVYPHLHKPDTRFNQNHYKTDVRFTGEAAAKVRDLLDEVAEEAYQAELRNYAQKFLDSLSGKPSAKAKKKAKKEALDTVVKHTGYKFEKDEDGEETDNIIVGFKMKAGGKNKKTGEEWSRTLPIYDATGQAVPAGLKVGGGSRIRVNFDFGDAFAMTQQQGAVVLAGYPRYMNAVQVIELETWAERDAKSFGFDEAEEGGFSADDVDDSAFAGPPDFSGGDEDDWDDDDDNAAGDDWDF